MTDYVTLPEVTSGGVDYVTTPPITIKGGDISVPQLSNLAYDTPYQLKYAGMLVKFASTGSLTLTGAGGNTLDLNTPRLVAVPCGDGERPSGWVYVPTLQPSLLGRVITGGSGTYLPLTANLNSETPPYAPDINNFTKVTVAALQPGDIVGMPMAAATTMVAGQEVAAAANGVVEVASSTDIVIGVVKTGNNNSAGLIGAKNVEVEIVSPYTKA